MFHRLRRRYESTVWRQSRFQRLTFIVLFTFISLASLLLPNFMTAVLMALFITLAISYPLLPKTKASVPPRGNMQYWVLGLPALQVMVTVLLTGMTVAIAGYVPNQGFPSERLNELAASLSTHWVWLAWLPWLGLLFYTYLSDALVGRYIRLPWHIVKQLRLQLRVFQIALPFVALVITVLHHIENQFAPNLLSDFATAWLMSQMFLLWAALLVIWIGYRFFNSFKLSLILMLTTQVMLMAAVYQFKEMVPYELTEQIYHTEQRVWQSLLTLTPKEFIALYIGIWGLYLPLLAQWLRPLVSHLSLFHQAAAILLLPLLSLCYPNAQDQLTSVWQWLVSLPTQGLMLSLLLALGGWQWLARKSTTTSQVKLLPVPLVETEATSHRVYLVSKKLTHHLLIFGLAAQWLGFVMIGAGAILLQLKVLLSVILAIVCLQIVMPRLVRSDSS